MLCEISPYTELSHGRSDNLIPPSSEWFAFDIEMSHGITGSWQNPHMLTCQTVKPIQCLYFDGTSAALIRTANWTCKWTSYLGIRPAFLSHPHATGDPSKVNTGG